MRDDLGRFLRAQDDTHVRALAELAGGRKQSHWMWWEIPQLRGLGYSARALEYGLTGFREAEAYLAHPILGARLVRLCEALMGHPESTADQIMGPVDARKLQSSLTVFAAIPGAPQVFSALLETFYQGIECPETLEMLAGDA